MLVFEHCPRLLAQLIEVLSVALVLFHVLLDEGVLDGLESAQGRICLDSGLKVVKEIIKSLRAAALRSNLRLLLLSGRWCCVNRVDHQGHGLGERAQQRVVLGSLCWISFLYKEVVDQVLDLLDRLLVIRLVAHVSRLAPQELEAPLDQSLELGLVLDLAAQMHFNELLHLPDEFIDLL